VRPYSEQVLRALENRYGPLPEGVPSVAYIFEPGIEGRCLYISPSVEGVLGYPRRQWLEERGLWDRILHPDDADRVVSNEAECARSGEKLVQEYRLRSADGRDVWIRDEMTVVFDRQTGKDPLFYGVFLDVSDRKRMETELERLALYDPLTGLPNRALFADRLRHVLARRGRDSATAVYFLDLDRFKRINDSLGHTAGDEVLREVAQRLQSVVRPEDTVARFGGDEFTVLCESVGGVLEAVAIADRLQRPLRRALRAGGAELRLSASIGVALVEASDNGDGLHLIEDADAAMYRAKERGGARTELFDTAMRDDAVRAMRIEQELQSGIERDELRLFYQPGIDLQTGQVVGAEALVRWEHPELGLIVPDRFLAVAEETGLIVPVGGWVMAAACRKLAEWQARPATAHLRLSVNLSARELTHPDVVSTVLDCVRQSGVDPHGLTIEVTESTAMADGDTGFRALRDLSAEGIRVAIDDFGTGYSSLDQLRRMPVDIVKVDRSFVSGMSEDMTDRELVAAVVGMGRALKLCVVAEGIETAEQAETLREMGCDIGQGYLFSQPLPEDQLEALVAAGVAPLTTVAQSGKFSRRL
jgi:diguanylate cyclase (GGDEF)-like protein/PAS domain S-box-containing protein